ncbi:MAG: hypothetical protein ABL931_01390 [Usitatibacteraceae bacterium]
MSISLNLGVAILGDAAGAATRVAKSIVESIAEPFDRFSGRDIRLKPYLFKQDMPGDFSGPMSNIMMHTALEAVTGDQTRQTDIKNLGLLIADSYEYRDDFLGLMFDMDFEPSGSNIGALTAREGCALFLEGINQVRSGEDFFREALYTAVHEVGHVFNLQHSDPPSFMAQSASEKNAFRFNTSTFNPFESTLLAQCSKSEYIRPGGSAFGNLGPLGGALEYTEEDAANAKVKFELRVRMSHEAFHAFEPVELDVELSLAEPKVKRAVIPDKLDPGYEEFVIWIEEPDGARRRYQSPQHFCGQKKTVTLATNSSVKRDINIFGERGAYTFRKCGVHRVWVTFKASSRQVVRSNVVECCVLPWVTEGEFNLQGQKLLSTRSIAKLLYHRRFVPRRMQTLARLIDFCTAFDNRPSVHFARYSIGRALVDKARRASKRNLPVAAIVRQANEILKKSSRSPHLGDHRQSRIVNDCVELAGM